MKNIDFSTIIKKAWQAYDGGKTIEAIYDVSANVSTNHVFKVIFQDASQLFAKLSYYGKFEHFREDHTLIHLLSKNLRPPYENFLACSLIKNGEVFMYRFCDEAEILDAWVVFYEPVKIRNKLPRRLEEDHIRQLGSELAHFHKACGEVSERLPPSSKTLATDVEDLLTRLDTEKGRFDYRGHQDQIREQCHRFLQNLDALNYADLPQCPVFIDWNIGNFSITEEGKFFSRWDYDWFRVCSRVMDFYFFSRVVSDVGDRTVFSYLVDPLMEDRFIRFLREYHRVYPLSEAEVRMLGEAYRFFIINYVIKDGQYFFHEIYASRLQREAYSLYLPSIEARFDAETLVRALDL
ncbi:MAG: hypothetical protein HC880_15940 [Bacteroidia bacterium]|nr:hypothetical protein [Bacteroidia bacterium]